MGLWGEIKGKDSEWDQEVVCRWMKHAENIRLHVYIYPGFALWAL